MSWLTKLLRGPDAPMLSATSGTAPGEPSSGAPAGAPSRGSGLTGAQLRARLATTPVTTFREGYDKSEVEGFAERAAAALDGVDGSLAPEDVLNQRFQATKFREGYDQDAIDDLLDEVVVALRARG